MARAARKPPGQSALSAFQPPVMRWFEESFGPPTLAQTRGWPPILAGQSTLLLAPTGSGKTLAAFLAAIDRLMFSDEPAKRERCRVLYVSPLKALGVDVERNLRAPIAGIAAAAARDGVPHRVPTVGVRSGDTPAAERTKLGRAPPDILITTPESLYLLLTSGAREILAFVETVIIDEIHSMVASKRGAHLFLSLERLELCRAKPSGSEALADRPGLLHNGKGRGAVQRIGLSATQRPLDEVARLLGGGDVAPGESGPWRGRPVAIIDAGSRKAWKLCVEVPVEDMARLAGEAAVDPPRRSIWPSIHPRLVELVRAHRSTMIFANSRRLAERLAAALNELAGEEIALAHHGSVARDRRQEIEDRLKRGDLPAIVATSSLELGLDMGAVDLVIQIEAPPSVASGIQRIGRAGHSVGATSEGVIFPKYRGDLLACAAATVRMREGLVEETFYPRNPLDVLAQQIVAIAAMDPIEEGALYALVRRAAPFAELPRASFEGVLDMLSGRYPSDEFAELRPRLTWDRVAGVVRARQGAKQLAVVSGGTIPDRGLYGVYLAAGGAKGTASADPRHAAPLGSAERDASQTKGTASADPRHAPKSRRVGELDEEMVFESRVGDIFLLGASSWRIEEITHDRVLVSPAPGQPGKMPFWHGDRPGRPVEFGRAIGELSRGLLAESPARALARLRDAHGLDERAASNLLVYLTEQAQATGEVPSDRAIIIERTKDELGDHRVCVLTPFGARVHAPWASAVIAERRDAGHPEVEAIWSDDGIAFRLPESDSPPDIEQFLPAAAEVEDLVIRGLGETSLFAARFRENAARALLLPRRFPGRRSPLWAQRKRAADLLAVASRYGSFPLLLETYRECLRDVFDLPSLVDLMRRVAANQVRVVTVDSRVPSPFAASLLFSYVANFIYDGDAPLAERRAQALSVDPAQLRELLGEADLRELLDAQAIEELERTLQRVDGRRPATSPDGLHDMLLSLGDLTREAIQARSEPPGEATGWLDDLVRERRVIEVEIAGERRFAAVEDAARLRDALGVALPPGLPAALLEPVADPLGDLVSRHARTHAPFLLASVAARFGIEMGPVRGALDRMAASERVIEGEFTPGGRSREWCDAEVLRSLKRRSLARLRREVEPVEPAALGRFLGEWQGVRRPRAGIEALLAVIEQLQGAPIPASVLESDVLPARIEKYRSTDLDVLCAAGEVVWLGVESLGERDGRVALYLAHQLPLLAPPARAAAGDLAARLRGLFAARGALFFADLIAGTGAFPGDLLSALWDLVWAGEVTNDTFTPLRAYLRGVEPSDSRRAARAARGFRPRRAGPPGSEGRWSLIARPQPDAGASGVVQIPGVTETERRAALTRSLLDRHGVLTREAAASEGILGGFSAVYDVLKAMEEAGKVRRGYFVAGLGATQFALPGADDRLRGLRDRPADPAAILLAATDPANPYGAALPWPQQNESSMEGADADESAAKSAIAGAAKSAVKGAAGMIKAGVRSGGRPQRAAGAQVILIDGALAGYLGRGGRSLSTFLPELEPERGRVAQALVAALAENVERGHRRAILLADVDGDPPWKSPLGPYLTTAGFTVTSRGYFKRGPSGTR